MVRVWLNAGEAVFHGFEPLSMPEVKKMVAAVQSGLSLFAKILDNLPLIL
jgi:hypothetical protein